MPPTDDDIERLEQLRDADGHLLVETVKRLDQALTAQETAVAAALAAAEKAVNAALVASEKAVDKAEVAQGKVNETQNEFRGALRDQAATQMPRSEAENVFRELRGLISDQNKTIAELRSRLDTGPPSLGVLQARSDRDEGKAQGGMDARSLLGWAVGIVAALVAIYMALN